LGRLNTVVKQKKISSNFLVFPIFYYFEFNFKFQNIQLNIMNDEENIDSDDSIEVVFSVVIPKRCFEQSNSRVFICFLVENSNTYQRLELRQPKQEKRNFEETADSHHIQTTYQFSKKLLTYNIFYYYYCVNQTNESNMVAENNLLGG